MLGAGVAVVTVVCAVAGGAGVDWAGVERTVVVGVVVAVVAVPVVVGCVVVASGSTVIGAPVIGCVGIDREVASVGPAGDDVILGDADPTTAQPAADTDTATATAMRAARLFTTASLPGSRRRSVHRGGSRGTQYAGPVESGDGPGLPRVRVIAKDFVKGSDPCNRAVSISVR